MMGTAENISALRSLLSIVAEETGALLMDDAAEESVGWTTEGPLPMTFGHVRRAHTALAVLEAAISTDAGPVGWHIPGSTAITKDKDITDRWAIGNPSAVIAPVYAEPVKTAPAVAVKALEWADRGETVQDRFKACSIVGDYYVSKNSAGLYSWRLPALRGSVVVGRAEEAKAAAQADYEARIRSALSAQVQDVAGWQPIETAPKDETPLLLCCTDWPHSTHLGKPVPIKVGGFGPNGWHVFGASWTPTHWMPLPASPASKHGDAE